MLLPHKAVYECNSNTQHKHVLCLEVLLVQFGSLSHEPGYVIQSDLGCRLKANQSWEVCYWAQCRLCPKYKLFWCEMTKEKRARIQNGTHWMWERKPKDKRWCWFCLNQSLSPFLFFLSPFPALLLFPRLIFKLRKIVRKFSKDPVIKESVWNYFLNIDTLS